MDENEETIERLQEENGELHDRVSDLQQENDELKRQIDNLKSAINDAKDKAHEIWYDLGNA